MPRNDSMNASPTMIFQASVVAIDGRALAMVGPPGSGKSTLALALIDRGAQLIGDDAVSLEQIGKHLLASPPPNIAGLIEVHGVGLFEVEPAKPTPLALILDLGGTVERLPDDRAASSLSPRTVLDCEVPCLAFAPGDIAPAVRSEWALSRYGITFD